MIGQNIQSPFYEDHHHNLWFSTYEGINCYIRKHDHFFNDVIKKNNKPLEGYYIAHLDVDSNLWVSVQDEGIYHYNILTKKYQFLHPYDVKVQRLVVYEDPLKKNITQSFVYAPGVPGMQIFKYSPNKIYDQYKTRILFDGNSRELPKRNIYHIFPESDTLAWLATDTGLIAFNPIKNTYQTYPVSGGLTCIDNYEEDFFILSSFSNGLLIFDRSDRRFVRQYTQSDKDLNSLRSNRATNVYVDRDNVIWVSISGKGIDFADPINIKFDQRLISLDSLGLPDLVMNSLAEDKQGNIWCGSYGEGILITTRKGRLIRHLTTANSDLPNNFVINLFVDHKNRVWIETWGGLTVYDINIGAFIKVEPSEAIFYHTIQLKNKQTLLASIESGIHKVTEDALEKIKVERIKAITSNKPYIFLYEDTEGILWTCENAIVIKRYDPKQNFALIDSLPISGVVNGIYEKSGDTLIWIATSNGLISFEKKTKKIKIYDRANGLPSQDIRAISVDKQGYFWLGTARGVIRFTPDTMDIKHFNQADGLSGLEVSNQCFLASSDGSFWFGTNNGITVLNPDQFKLLPTTPKAQITRIMVNDEDMPTLICDSTGATNAGEMRKIVLKHNKNTLAFEFAALDYSDPTNSSFRYQLENYDEGWVGPIKEGRARYPNLPPGNYRLKIRVINSDGKLAPPENITNLTIIIKKPWWLEWWALSIEGLLLLALIFIGIFIYFRPRLAVAEIRERVSADLHDEIGSALTAIKIASQLSLANSANLGDDNNRSVKRIANISGETLYKMRNIIWANNPDNNSFEDILARMRAEANRMLPEHIELELPVLENELKKEKLTGDKRYHMQPIYKEALTNAIKYAEASIINVELFKKHRDLVLKISDNGKGYDFKSAITDDPSSGGNGLLNMQNRAQKLGGTVTFTSTPGEGFTVLLQFPMKEKQQSKLRRELKRLFNIIILRR